MREKSFEGVRGSLDQQETVYCDSASADGDHTNTEESAAFEGVPGNLQACEYILCNDGVLKSEVKGHHHPLSVLLCAAEAADC